ncbi:unnamed protein product, partial [Brassica oleracea]
MSPRCGGSVSCTVAAWRLRKRSRHGSTEAFRQRSSAVGGGGEIG